jgi:hypothetical protein
VQLGPVWGYGLGVGVAVNRTKSLSVGMCALWEVSLLSLVGASPSLALGMSLFGEVLSVWVSPLSGWVGVSLYDWLFTTRDDGCDIYRQVLNSPLGDGS